MITGNDSAVLFCLIFSSTSKPSMPGIMTSNTTRSGSYAIQLSECSLAVDGLDDQIAVPLEDPLACQPVDLVVVNQEDGDEAAHGHRAYPQ